jgi:hypothetical protein
LAEHFWNQPAESSAKPLPVRLARLLALLGFGDSSQDALWTCDDTTITEMRPQPAGTKQRREDSTSAAVDESQGFALGSLEVAPNQRLAVVWFDGPVPASGATQDSCDSDLSAALKAAQNMSGLVVPLPELARAASALLLAGGDEEFARAIRRSLATALTTASGVYRYSPGDTLLSPAERKLLQAAA